MPFIYCLQIALDNLRANKLRSLLTMLGIIIGVSAVIIMVAIMQGASANVTTQFNKQGSNLIFVAFAPTSEERKTITQRISGLKMDDVRAIKEHCPLVRSVSAEEPLGNGKAKYGGKDTDCTPYAVQPEYEQMRNAPVERGRFITQDDMDTWGKVCVVGSKIPGELFGKEEPIGKNIEVNGLTLTVVGVMAPKGQTFEGDGDKHIFLPLTTAQKRLLGQETVNTIYAEAVSVAQIDAAKDQIWQTLMRRYDNLPGWKVDSFDNIINSINQVLAIFTVLLGSIAGLALLVGGIGIMNIMLVSVTERTREIGIRKAIGAKRSDILLQFIIEAATVSGVGGLLGAAVGTGTAYGVGFLTTFIPSLDDKQSGTKGMPIFVPLWVIIGSFAFSAAVGLFFGIYPAVRASRLDPIQALRHE